MFRIKICGITSSIDADQAITIGADAIGLNFFPESPRYIAESLDRVRVAWTGPKAQRVGVFVNAGLDVIEKTIAQFRLTAIQLHGDESAEFLAKLPDLPVVRAQRMDDRGVVAIANDVAACKAAGRLPDAVLVDANTPGRYGGTGETVSWAALADHRKRLGDIPLILAGGLTPDNVAEAIRTVRPHGVDVASGVESSPGVKDVAKMRSFVKAARTAFSQISS